MTSVVGSVREPKGRRACGPLWPPRPPLNYNPSGLKTKEGISLERLLWCLEFTAYLLEEHPELMPIWERLEREVDALHARQNARNRAAALRARFLGEA